MCPYVLRAQYITCKFLVGSSSWGGLRFAPVEIEHRILATEDDIDEETTKKTLQLVQRIEEIVITG